MDIFNFIEIVFCKQENQSCYSAHHPKVKCSAVTMNGDTIYTAGILPKVGAVALDFILAAYNLSEKSLTKDYKGKNVILNNFPSLDTKVCAASVKPNARFSIEF